jgi:hypothetical protein
MFHPIKAIKTEIRLNRMIVRTVIDAYKYEQMISKSQSQAGRDQARPWHCSDLRLKGQPLSGAFLFSETPTQTRNMLRRINHCDRCAVCSLYIAGIPHVERFTKPSPRS